LTPDQEKIYWKKFKETDDTYSRDQILVEYMRVVKYIAGRMAIHVPSHIEMDDLVGWGVMGLMDAVEKFDPSQDIKFSTYASIRIRGAIIDQIRSLDWAPRSLRSMARKIGEAKKHLRDSSGKEPSNEDIADKLGISEDLVDDTVAQLQTAHLLSLDDYLINEDETYETRKSERISGMMPSPSDTAIEHEQIEMLVQGILQLPDQQQKVLNLYYYEELTLKEVGVVLNVSESRICQIHSAAMKRLRKMLREGG